MIPRIRLVPNMFRSKPVLPTPLLIIIFLTTAESTCPKTCDLALGSYNIWNNHDPSTHYTWNNASPDTIAKLSNTSLSQLMAYNKNITNKFFVQEDTRVNVPLIPCGCIAGEFLGHVFRYEVQSGDTYDRIARTYYANLTTPGMLERFNSYPATDIPDNAVLNVTVNCSCGDASVSEKYGLFVTYPLKVGESLESIAADAELSLDLLQSYNPGANFSAGSGLVYIPGRDKSGHYPCLKSCTGLTGRVIAGICLGVSLGALIAAVCIYRGFYGNKKVQFKELISKTHDDTPLQTGISVEKAVEFSYEELAKATDEFSIRHIIGQGGFGFVYYAELQCEKAAIKKMDMQAKSEFLAELKVLTRVHHLNLVRLIGYCVEGSLFLVYEYVDNGNLSQHLHGTGRDPLSWFSRVQIALDSARGLEYIHEHTARVYIHRDIKSANILIDKSFCAKVSDFGLAKLAEVRGSTRLVGTFGYMPPEYAQHCGDISPKVDVYAFGVVLYELISAKRAVVKSDGSMAEAKPLSSLFEEALGKPDARENLRKLIDPRLGHNYPLDSALKMAELAKACTEVNPLQRPDMRSVVVALMTLSSPIEATHVGSIHENQAIIVSPSDSLDHSDQIVEDSQGCVHQS